MKWYFLDVLACPVCKAYGEKLVLYPINEVEEDTTIDVEKVRCRDYCGLHRKPVSEVSIEECKKCVKKRIITGLIICTSCGRWYPIINRIPVMLDDKYRDLKLYRKFLKEYQDKIPDNIKKLMKNPDPGSL
ncbi:MAG: Trm112 family protein [Desulfurococcales archaeon]|nr:Trm112 family protein [Desulfurococcales archaeon]MEB3788568.1 Trm112 family protein [Desulfurococcales archaeon]